MNIELEKKELMKLLAETNVESIIMSIKSIFKKEEKDFWHELTEQQQHIINESEVQYERGDYVSFDEFIKPHL